MPVSGCTVLAPARPVCARRSVPRWTNRRQAVVVTATLRHTSDNGSRNNLDEEAAGSPEHRPALAEMVSRSGRQSLDHFNQDWRRARADGGSRSPENDVVGRVHRRGHLCAVGRQPLLTEADEYGWSYAGVAPAPYGHGV